MRKMQPQNIVNYDTNAFTFYQHSEMRYRNNANNNKKE